MLGYIVSVIQMFTEINLLDNRGHMPIDPWDSRGNQLIQAFQNITKFKMVSIRKYFIYFNFQNL